MADEQGYFGDPGNIISFPAPKSSDGIITITAASQKVLVTIRYDGTIEYGPDYTPDEAARIFWESLMLRAPRMCDCGKYGPVV